MFVTTLGSKTTSFDAANDIQTRMIRDVNESHLVVTKAGRKVTKKKHGSQQRNLKVRNSSTESRCRYKT